MKTWFWNVAAGKFTHPFAGLTHHKNVFEGKIVKDALPTFNGQSQTWWWRQRWLWWNCKRISTCGSNSSNSIPALIDSTSFWQGHLEIWIYFQKSRNENEENTHFVPISVAISRSSKFFNPNSNKFEYLGSFYEVFALRPLSWISLQPKFTWRQTFQ